MNVDSEQMTLFILSYSALALSRLYKDKRYLHGHHADKCYSFLILFFILFFEQKRDRLVFYSGGIYILAHKKWSMWSQLIAGFLLVISTTGFARLAYGVLMPFMQADLNMNYTQAGLLATTISLGLLAISP
ncbi:hypothetical protein [Peribacillus simplex]|uniref:hypothetical protein n=1 Tax=Peribacillus simplex TaxID=1478 RepID=UPI0024C168B1|nr:hypothetical protein [Peribacillus simplex]WHY58337.1 hypothetical protein QNH43_08750 [Peribacillus simplex]